MHGVKGAWVLGWRGDVAWGDMGWVVGWGGDVAWSDGGVGGRVGWRCGME